MPATVELVLAVDATAASEWMAGPAATALRGDAMGKARTHRGGRARAKPKAGADAVAAATASSDIGATLADAISRMPGVAALSGAQPTTVHVLGPPEGSKAPQRVLLTMYADGQRRLTARNMAELAPGVWRCETVCEVALQENGGAPVELSGAAPPFIQAALGKVDKRPPPPALAVRRSAWRWTSADGAIVDIELHDAGLAWVEAAAKRAVTPGVELDPGASATRDESPPRRLTAIGFCELRLACPIIEPQAATHAAQTATPPPTAAVQPTRAAAPATGAEGSLDRSDSTTSLPPTIAALQSLFAAAGALADTLPVFPVLSDGFARACEGAPVTLDAPARAGHVDLSSARHPHDALIAIGSSVTRHWFGNEAGARVGVDPEYVHQMRVALRRLKTLLKTFPRWADVPWQRAIAPELDWLGALLGQARDLDVFVDTTLASLAEADIEPDAWSTLRARAVVRRDQARAQVREALRTRRYAALSLAWLKWLAMQRDTRGPQAMIDKSLADYAAKRVRKHYARLVKKPGLTELTPFERHRRRIEAKRLRYTLEFFASLASRKTRRIVSKQLGRIQSVLGDGNDMTSALRFLEALDVSPYQHGYARGWCEAVLRGSAAEGERLLRDLPKPKIVRTR
jgi:CHAD domain-containing protein